MQEIAPGLDLTVDYGICVPIKAFIYNPELHIYECEKLGLGNHIITILIKFIFYPLSAAGCYIDGKIKKQSNPKMIIKERYSTDKTQMNQAIMKFRRMKKLILEFCFENVQKVLLLYIGFYLSVMIN